MNFNKKQRTILTVGVIVIILMGVFPPWAITYGQSVIHKLNAGYAFIAVPPDSSAVLDIFRLCLQWLVVLLATGLGVFLSRKSTWNRKKIIKWPWKKIATRTAIVITSLILLAGIVLCGRYIYLKITDRPRVQKEFWGLTLDSTKKDIKFLKGAPSRVEKEKSVGVERWYYHNIFLMDEEGLGGKTDSCLILFKYDKIVLITWQSFYIQHVGSKCSYEKVIKKFGKPSYIFSSEDDLVRVLFFEKYKVVFWLAEDQVFCSGIYNPSLLPQISPPIDPFNFLWISKSLHSSKEEALEAIRKYLSEQ